MAVAGALSARLRDTKGLRFGMGMGTVHVKTPERRDRLWLINAFPMVLLTLLGAPAEALGCDRLLKTNTAKRRVPLSAIRGAEQAVDDLQRALPAITAIATLGERATAP
jgi:hypothetical protein